ncbi:MAG: glycosyltransferase family 4 protein, partial [Mariprofundus sp.]|nr:glycosyltransferase family 4 protein [Mariprofundus sp.]
IPLSAKALLSFGQIKEVKRLDLLLDAMPAVLKQHPDALLLIAGRPWKTDFSSYQEQIDRLGIQNACMTQIRFITDEELPYYYAVADLVVLPYERIYQSAVVIMAMSYGKAVLVSDLPGMSDIVSSDDYGYIFKQGNLTALVQELCLALGDKTERQKRAYQGLQHMRNDYDWNIIGKRTKELYETINM